MEIALSPASPLVGVLAEMPEPDAAAAILVEILGGIGSRGLGRLQVVGMM